MAAERVIERTYVELSAEGAVTGGSKLTVMMTDFLRKRPRFPSFHPSGNDGDMIDPAVGYWNEAADPFKALPPEKLTGPGDMLNTHNSIIVTFTVFLKRGTDDTQRGIL